MIEVKDPDFDGVRCASCYGIEDIKVISIKNDKINQGITINLCYQCRGDAIRLLEVGVYDNKEAK